ncbi:MAG: hypothetical protein ACRDKY_08985 [Solirubrobacteraceae bacterium]
MASMARAIKMSRRYLAASLALAGILGASIVAVSQGDSGMRPDLPLVPPDSAPASKPSIVARTSTIGGGQLGVATYRNASGRLCAAFGRAKEEALVDRRGKAVAIGDTGDCTMRPDPVAVHVIAQADDPTYTDDVRSLVIWGLAASSVETIEIAVGPDRRALTPGRDGAFVLSLPPNQGNVEFTLRESNGRSETLAVPPAPDIDEINAQLKAGRIPLHQDGGP